MSNQTTTIRVGGMTCGGCVRHVTNALRAQPGVTEVEVRLDPLTREGTARIAFDAELGTLESLRHAIEEAGYEAR